MSLPRVPFLEDKELYDFLREIKRQHDITETEIAAILSSKVIQTLTFNVTGSADDSNVTTALANGTLKGVILPKAAGTQIKVEVSAGVSVERTGGTIAERLAWYQITNATSGNMIAGGWEGRTLIGVSAVAAIVNDTLSLMGRDKEYSGDLAEQTYILQHKSNSTNETSKIINTDHAQMIITEYLP